MRPLDTAIRQRGIFDRSSAGYRSAPVSVDVERGRVALFSKAIAERNPIHWNPEAARAAGFPDVVAPPTFAAVIDVIANDLRMARNERSILEIIHCDPRFLHGEERYDYHAPIFAGESVIVHCRVDGFEDKKNGTLELAHLTTCIEHERRGPLVSITRSFIHQL